MARRLLFALALLLGLATTATATDRKVCATCTYTTLQQAVDAAQPGDDIYTVEGAVLTENVVGPVKTGTGWITIKSGINSTGVIQSTSRYTAANVRICPSTYVSEPDPIDGTTYTCAGLAGSQDMTHITTLTPATNNAYAFRTAATGSGTPVAFYRFQNFRFLGNPYGGNALFGVLNDTAPLTTGAIAMLPHDIECDRCVIEGDPVTGQFRGTQLDGVNISIINSHFANIWSQNEGQALWFNGPGPYIFRNNYIKGGAEVLFSGGSGTRPSPRFTVQAPATSATVFGLSAVTDLVVTQTIAVYSNPQTVTSATATSPAVFTVSGGHNILDGYQVVFAGQVGCSNVALTSGAYTVFVLSPTTFTLETPYNESPVTCTTALTAATLRVRAAAEITSLVGNTVTVSPPLPYKPDIGDQVDASLVPTGVTIEYNWLTRDPSERTTPIIAPPSGVSATPATTGGTLAAGAHTYRVMTRLITNGSRTANSGAAAAVTCTTTGATGTCTIGWTAVTHATDYVVYRTDGTARYWVVTAPTVSYIDTGTAGTTGSPIEVANANYKQSKNILELKTSRSVVIRNNIIENQWAAPQGGAGQTGGCVLLTSSMQGIDGAPSAVIRDVAITLNDIRHCAQVGQIQGMDAQGYESARSGNISWTQNVIRDIGLPWGQSSHLPIGLGGGPRQHPNRSVFDLTIEHNTFKAATAGPANNALYVITCEPIPRNLTPSNESPIQHGLIRNNIWDAGPYNYGFVSTGVSAPACGNGQNPSRIGKPPFDATSIFANNVLAGSTCPSALTSVTTNTVCPTVAALVASTFTSLTTLVGHTVAPGSPYLTAATDGTMIGADVSLLLPGQAIVKSGDLTGVGGGDVTAPTVSVTAPGTGATVSGTAQAVTATAADAVGVVGVQFKLDGVVLGAEDTVAPYSYTWNTTTATPGSHTLTAIARDAAGNTTTSASLSVTVAGAAAGYAATVIANSPSGFWKLSDASGTVAVNSSGSAANGTYAGSPALAQAATPLVGDTLTSVLFDGVDDYVTVADSAGVNASGDFTLEAWIKSPGLTDVNARLFYKLVGGTGYSFHVTTSTGAITFDLRSAGVDFQIATPLNYLDNAWHHAVAVRSGSSGSIYVDGVLKVGPVTMTANDVTNTATLYMGSNDGISRRWIGNLFGMAVYPVALSASDIAAHYAARGDLTPPVVTMTVPLTGAAVSGAAVTVTATASDNVALTSVQFKLDGVNLGAADTVTPFTISWNSTTASNGTHQLTAVATDTSGNTTTSAAITVTTATDTTLPVPTITAPAAAATVSGTAVPFTATVTDNVGVATVYFRVDGSTVSTQTVAPFSYTWNTAALVNGPHTLAVTAYDTAGNIANAFNDVTVNNVTADNVPPTAGITTPLVGANVSGTAAVITSSATDNILMAGVVFKVDGVALGPQDTVAPYTTTWNTRLYGNGPHTISVVATDWQGNTTTNSVLVTVANDITPPVVVITQPHGP